MSRKKYISDNMVSQFLPVFIFVVLHQCPWSKIVRNVKGKHFNPAYECIRSSTNVGPTNGAPTKPEHLRNTF